PGLLLAHDVLRHRPHFGLDTASAHGAHNRPVIANEDLRALVAWDRTLHLDDGGERRPASFLSEPSNLFVDIHPVKRLNAPAGGVNGGAVLRPATVPFAVDEPDRSAYASI